MLVLNKQKWTNAVTLNFIFSDDAFITELNYRFLNKKAVTDVIAFNLNDHNRNGLDGEVYINLDQTVRQANEFKIPFDEELIRLVSHGVLHLLGFTDDTATTQQKMHDHENDIIFSIFGHK